MTEEKEMPYSGEFNVAYEIVEIVGKEGKILTSNLYKQVNARNTPTKSHSKRIAEFLDLIKTSGQYVEITDSGKIFVSHRVGQDRKKFLANNLPKKYSTLLRWIKNAKDGSIELSQLRESIVKNKIEYKKNNRLYDLILNMFANFAEDIGVIQYIKGKNSRCIITPFGEEVLSSDKDKTNQENKDICEENKDKKPKQIFYADINLEGNYPIRIMTNDGKPFDWDIYNEEDWVVVESALNAIKKRWKSKNLNKETNKK